METNSMMTLPLKKVKEVLDKIFTSTGYSFKDINIKFPQPLNMTFGSNGNNVSLIFLKDLPKISWKKFITLSAWIEGIVLSDDGGTIKIKYLPDIKFSYTKDAEQNFGQIEFDTTDIEKEISSQYPDEERKKIANVCLQYAKEWVIICNSAGLSKEDFRSNRKLKKDCYYFVKDCIKKEEKHGSIVGFVVLFVILPVILKWIIEKIFAKLTS